MVGLVGLVVAQTSGETRHRRAGKEGSSGSEGAYGGLIKQHNGERVESSQGLVIHSLPYNELSHEYELRSSNPLTLPTPSAAPRRVLQEKSPTTDRLRRGVS